MRILLASMSDMFLVTPNIERGFYGAGVLDS